MAAQTWSTKQQIRISDTPGGNTNVKNSRRYGLAKAVVGFSIAIAAPSHAEANDRLQPTLAPKASPKIERLSALDRRFHELREYAEEDEIEVSEDSYLAVRKFVSHSAVTRLPSVMLADDGTFRAIWRSNDEQQVALHFKTDIVQFVIFVLNEAGQMERATGQASANGLLAKLDGFGAKGLLSSADA